MKKILDKFSETIGVYPEALTEEFCNSAIRLFETDHIREISSKGSTLSGENLNIKNSLDFNICLSNEFKTHVEIITLISNRLIEEYIWTWDDKDDPTWYSDFLFGAGTYYPIWNMQKYAKGEGHYNGAHVESVTADPPEINKCSRIFTCMFYLNDVAEGGETVFPYCNLKISPKAGTFVCWPAPWPYVHKGLVPISNDKYIVTTWLQALWDIQNK